MTDLKRALQVADELHARFREPEVVILLRELAAEVERLSDSQTKNIIQVLIHVGTGKLNHFYRGLCPDPASGYQTRDIGCPACNAISAAGKLITAKY